MSPKEKNKATLLTAAIGLGVLIFIASSWFFTQKIPLKYIIICALIIEVFVAMPYLNIQYYKLQNVEMGYKKFISFIPYLNYTVSVSPIIEIICHILFGIFLLVCTSLFFPNVYSFLGEIELLRLIDKSSLYIVILLLLLNIVIGVGLYQVTSDINKIYNKAFPSGQFKKSMKFIEKVYRCIPFLEIILLIIPIGRAIPLLSGADRAYTMTNIGLNISNIKDYNVERD